MSNNLGFTGVPDIDRIILSDLDDESLCNALNSCKFLSNIANSVFWKQRIIKYYGYCPESKKGIIPQFKKYYIKFIDKRCKKCKVIVTDNYGCDYCGFITCDDCYHYQGIALSHCSGCKQQYCYSIGFNGIKNCPKMYGSEICDSCDNLIVPKYKRIFTGRDKPTE